MLLAPFVRNAVHRAGFLKRLRIELFLVRSTFRLLRLNNALREFLEAGNRRGVLTIRFLDLPQQFYSLGLEVGDLEKRGGVLRLVVDFRRVGCMAENAE